MAAKLYIAGTLILQLFSICYSHTTENQTPIANISQGLVQGSLLISTSGKPIYSFRGIPFAKPPVGDLRFKQAQTAEPWSGVFNATNDDHVCPQQVWNGSDIIGNEDCLTINVYTPVDPAQLKSTSRIRLPVLFFIHGGGFLQGSSGIDFFGPQRFLNKMVILVTANYRLGALGFLSTEDDASEGNFGLYDQVLGLKWVKQNIAAFGGDPDRVTIFGESAGAFSVGYQIISPLSADLFQNAIMQSGTALCMFGVKKDPYATAKKLASALNCPTGNSQRLINCLRTKPARSLVLLSELGAWYPSIEKHNNPKKLLPSHPLQLLKNGKLNVNNVIIGLNKFEGSLWVYGFPNLTEEYKNFNKFVSDGLGTQLLHFLDYPIRERKVIARKAIRKYSINRSTPIEEAKLKLTDLMSDSMFVNGSDWFANELVGRNVTVRRYLFDSDRTRSVLTYIYNTTVHGPSHSDELLVQFQNIFFQTLTADEEVISRHFIELWTNYARTNNPNVANCTRRCWQPVRQDRQSFLRIDVELSRYRGSFHQKRVKFWRNYFIH